MDALASAYAPADLVLVCGLLAGILAILLLGFGLLGVLRGKLSIGALTAFYALADRFADGCQKLQELLHEVHVIRPSCTRYFELLDRQTAMSWAGGATPARCNGAFELSNVTKAFPGRSNEALHGISLRVKPGETLALVGPSGPLRQPPYISRSPLVLLSFALTVTVHHHHHHPHPRPRPHSTVVRP